MNNDDAITVKHVYKNFVLPHEQVNSIKGLFTSIIKRPDGSKGSSETQHALENIDFTIKQGEFFGIVGRNGSGKSTLLKILAGIYQPTKGSVVTRGKLVPFIELGVGFNPELTGRENVYLNGALLGFSHKEIERMYDDIVAFAELEKFMDQKLKNYSSGMQVRLAFSMATRSEADILLVDEVLAVGDTDFQAKCFTFFKELKRRKKTIVFVSHDMNSIREYCDRAVLIDKANIICQGSPAKVAGEYSKLFIEDKDKTDETQETQDRWGDRSAEIHDPRVVVADKAITLSFDVTAREAINDLMLGYYVTNEAGQQICGTNTQVLEANMVPLKAGGRRSVQFGIDNVFADGIYEVTLAALRNNGTSTADWWVNPVQLTIKKAQHVPYLIDAPVVFTYKEIA